MLSISLPLKSLARIIMDLAFCTFAFSKSAGLSADPFIKKISSKMLISYQTDVSLEFESPSLSLKITMGLFYLNVLFLSGKIKLIIPYTSPHTIMCPSIVLFKLFTLASDSVIGRLVV